MKPMIILPPGAMSADDIKTLRDNDICVVVAEKPEAVKFVDPLPAVSSRTQIENAAIKFSRILLTKSWGNFNTAGSLTHRDFTAIFTKCLLDGTPLDTAQADEDFQRAKNTAFRDAKLDEVRKIAREEARSERAASKAAKAITK